MKIRVITSIITIKIIVILENNNKNNNNKTNDNNNNNSNKNKNNNNIVINKFLSLQQPTNSLLLYSTLSISLVNSSNQHFYANILTRSNSHPSST